MKKLFFSLAMMTISGLWAFSQTTSPKPAAAPVDKDAPEIIFEKTEHDFGKIPFGGNGLVEFTYKNMGKNPLILENVKASCGCTTPAYSKEPLKKKASAAIKVQYDTKRVGPFTKSVTVYSNGKNSPTTLIIKGEVLPNDQKSDPAPNKTMLEQPKRIPENK